MGRPLWNRVVWVRFLEYLLKMDMGNKFTTVEFRRWAEGVGVPPPPDPRAYGNISKRAVKEGFVRDTGVRVRNGSHGREVVLFERVK